MEHNRYPETDQVLDENMLKWLRLRRELEERITDPETRTLLHKFMELDLAMFVEESREAFERGKAAGKCI